MRAAPPVSVRCHGGAGWVAVQVALPALAGGVAAYWALARAEWPTLPAAAAAVAAAGWAWHCRPPAEALLAWDGQRWSADGATGELDVMIDLDRWLLLRLRLRGSDTARWIAVSAAAAGPAWHALRVAAFATPAAAADAGKGGGDNAGAGSGDPDRPTRQAAAR